jgi:CHAT domain/Effector-associated domain 11
MIKIFKASIRKLIERNKSDLAIRDLLAFAKKFRPDLVDDLTVLSAQIKAAKRDEMLSLSDSNEQKKANARNAAAIIDFLGQLEDEEEEDEAGAVSEPAAHTETPAPATGETPPQSTAAIPSGTAKYKFKLLFLGANPPGTTNLRIREEHSRITEKLADEKRQHEYLVLTEFYARASDWQEILIRDKPDIIHFSGHGTDQGLGHASDGSLEGDRLIHDAARKKQKAEEAERLKGIVMYDESMRRPQLVSTVALDDLFSLVTEEDLGIQVKAVLLNACFSENQAIAIGKYVEYVIGTSDAVPDEAAIQFAAGFYFGMTQTMGIERAFRTGRTRALMTGLNDKNLFVLYKNGVKKEI